MRWNVLAFAVLALVMACAPQAERSAPRPLKEASGIELVRIHGTVVIPYAMPDAGWSRDMAREHLVRWARTSLFDEFDAVLDGRYLGVTLRSSELLGSADPPLVVGEYTRVAVDVLVRGPGPLKQDFRALPRAVTVDTSGCEPWPTFPGTDPLQCPTQLSELVLERGVEPPALGSLESLREDGLLDLDVFFVTRGMMAEGVHELGLATSEHLESWGFRIESRSNTAERWTRVLTRGPERVRIVDVNRPMSMDELQQMPSPPEEETRDEVLAAEIAEALRTRDVVILHDVDSMPDLASSPLAGSKDQLLVVEGADPISAASAVRGNPTRGPDKSLWFVGIVGTNNSRIAVAQTLGMLMAPDRVMGPRALEDGMNVDFFDPDYIVLHRFGGGS